MATNDLRQALAAGQFVHTAELVLGRDYTLPEAEQFVKDAASVANGIKVISVTDLPGGNPAIPPEAFASFMLEHKLTPLIHYTSKDGNRTFLEGRLYTLARLGVENVLALSGDAPTSGYLGKPKPVYDFDSVLLVRLAAEIRKGMFYQAGKRTLQTPPFDFLIGSVVNPFKVFEPALMTQLYKLELKIRCGANFIITQVGYNLRKLYELKQYMNLEGLGHVPVLANVYVPTATIAKLMQAAEIPGCVVPERLVQRLENEKKPQRLERAALMVAAAKDLGFAGAHIGGFGLSHSDILAIIEKAAAIGGQWRERLDELIFETEGADYYLFPSGKDGLSDDTQAYNTPAGRPKGALSSRVFLSIHAVIVSRKSPVSKYYRWKLNQLRQQHGAEGDVWRRGLSYHSLDFADIVKHYTLGCVNCGDCLQDYMSYSGCSMGKCAKETRNGPCGGSRINGACEVKPDMQCVWNTSYLSLREAGQDPRKFSHTLLPPRDWTLNQTNSLANYLAEVDSNQLRRKVELKKMEKPG